MPTYQPPVRDVRFVLHELLGWERHANLPGFADAPADLVDSIIEEGGRFMADVLAPLNQVGDHEGCTWNDGAVTTPAGFREAYRAYREAGWGTLTAAADHGGQGLPHTLGFVISEMASSANMAFAMYPGLSHGAYEALLRHGTDEQKRLYLPKLVSGEWTGTMNLTEPHCGTDLGLLRTRAEPQDDGSYRITGTKIFISAGEHDLADNIVHLVLAKIPGGPAGVRGISLFVVPKFLPDADGNPGSRNQVACGSIEEKMGIHGNATCVMNYDGAAGWLVGDAHRGLNAMFTMMNAARLGVGMQGLGQAEVAYQNALVYARERRQGRALTGPAEPGEAADPIIVHPDVRRMLMTCKAFVEGARALALWTGLQLDVALAHPDERARRDADDFVSLVTPVIKAYFTDMGSECANLAMQCFGGHGYIREWGMEQFVRDARIAQIYEGANGIQALDLVGRKMGQNTGRLLRSFFHPLDAFLQRHQSDARMKPYAGPLARAFGRLQTATSHVAVAAMKDPDEAGAASSDYLRLFALVALGWMWAESARIALDRLEEGTEEQSFYEAKLATARFFMDRMLPDTAALQQKVQAGAASTMALAPDRF